MLTSLHTLSLQGGHFTVEHLEKLTQLSSLSLISFDLHRDFVRPFCQLPPSLTSLNMASCACCCATRITMSRLLHFQAHLQSLTLGGSDMLDLDNSTAKLSALACLQQLTHLQFAMNGGELNGCTELHFPKLQSLHAQFVNWPNVEYPHWHLGGCPELRTMTLLYYDDLQSEAPVVDLRGIHGCQLTSLHIELHLAEYIRALAAFDAWRLDAVSIGYVCSDPGIVYDRTEWPKSQSVRDILGCLACHVPASKVTVNGERVCDRIVKQRFPTELQPPDTAV